jgi:hypothetical protein
MCRLSAGVVIYMEVADGAAGWNATDMLRITLQPSV